MEFSAPELRAGKSRFSRDIGVSSVTSLQVSGMVGSVRYHMKGAHQVLQQTLLSFPDQSTWNGA